MTGNGPPPKRRRTTNAPVYAEAHAIAQSNATVNHFTGQGNRSTWSQMEGNGSGPGGAVQTRTAQSLVTNPAWHPTTTFTTQPQQRQQESTTMWTNEAAIEANGMTAEDAIVVDYESPYTRPSSTTTVSGRNSGKSPDQTTTATRQGLPSPAPSDENNNSPMVAGAALPARRPSRQSRSSTGFALANSPTAAAPTTVYTTQDSSSRQVPLSQLPHSANMSLPGEATALFGSPMLGQQGYAPSPLLTQQPSPVTAGVILRSNMQMQSPVADQQMQQMQQPLAAPPSLGAFYDLQELLQRINGQLQIYERQDPSGNNICGETGRLCLLREAVQKRDYFYIVLSQVFCLRSVDPVLLPQVMSGISNDSYNHLDELLCANSTMQGPLVQWFANFPKPIMGIYASPQGQAYDAQLREVVQFLQVLPQNWFPIVLESRKRLALPLVQDMTERLRLFSPVLQTTAFRAIARMFWGSSPDLEALVGVHYVDQRTFKPWAKRSPREVERAYAAYKLIFYAWRDHVAKQTSQRVSTNSGHGKPFQIPEQAFAAFGVTMLPHPAIAPMQQRPPYQRQSTDPRQQPQQVRTPSSQPPQPLRTSSFGNYVPTPPSPAEQLLQQLQQEAFNGLQQVPAIQHTLPQPRGQRRLFPSDRDCPRAQPTHPDSTRAALHQAHLRSPIPGFAEVQPGAPKLFRHVKCCVLSPTRMEKDIPMQSFTFDAEDYMHRLAKTKVHPDHLGQSIRLPQAGTVTFRLRCCREDQNQGFLDLSSWVTSNCFWPETVYFDINGNPLEPRRKLQHGRYQALDLTPHIKSGMNELKVLVNRASSDTSPFDFAIAVEVVETISEESIINGIPTVGATASLNEIQSSLAGDVNDADDDVVMTSGVMNINLFDPISGARIFDTPVRGSKCKHRDPFDLDTFLSTRKRDKPGYPAVVDDWLCPICRGDVRPDELRKDAFLIQVRQHLELLNALDTRAIAVNAEGSWTIKDEERTGVRSGSLEAEEQGAEARSRAAKKAAPVVIELD